MFVGSMALDLGASSPFLYCWREREKILDFPSSPSLKN
jgi:NADH:ubiquinone oxidoreductase subunit D